VEGINYGMNLYMMYDGLPIQRPDPSVSVHFVSGNQNGNVVPHLVPGGILDSSQTPASFSTGLWILKPTTQ